MELFGNTRVFFICVIITSLLCSKAHALECYACATKDYADCTTCNIDGGVCMKGIGKAGNAAVYLRSCAKSCEETTVDQLGISFTNDCCSTDRCNSATLPRLSLLLSIGLASICLIIKG
jgi:hypothetical protein